MHSWWQCGESTLPCVTHLAVTVCLLLCWVHRNRTLCTSLSTYYVSLQPISLDPSSHMSKGSDNHMVTSTRKSTFNWLTQAIKVLGCWTVGREWVSSPPSLCSGWKDSENLARQIFWLQEDGLVFLWCLAVAVAFTQCKIHLFAMWARHENGKKSYIKREVFVYDLPVKLISFVFGVSFPLCEFDQLRLPKQQNHFLNTVYEISCWWKIFLLSLVTSNHILWLLTSEDEVQYRACETR